MHDENIDYKVGEILRPLSAEKKLAQEPLKENLSLLLICIFYVIGWDLLSYHVGQLNSELEFYPLATILLYIVRFYLASGICVLTFVLLYFSLYSIKNYSHRPFWKQFVGNFKNQFLSSQQIYGALFIFMLVPPFFAFVGMYKQLIPFVSPFSWDKTFMHWDYILHFHHQPWELLQPLIGYPLITNVLAEIYSFWFTMMAGLILWQAVSKERFYRMQFFLTFFLSWIILGTIMAYYFSSAGPCFYNIYSHDASNPYVPLMSYLSDNAPSWITELQNSLLVRLLSRNLIFGGGVSAMPSMHLSMVTLCFLICAKHNKWLALVAFIFLILTFISSIQLAWHYAVDCYVSIIATTLIWYCMGKVLRYLDKGSL